jgi:pyruvate/2-oxoacid:ferredoxin oxidoreductase alpha subunit
VKKLLSGNVLIARVADESDVHVAAAYPGTPSSEILENIARYPEIYAEWAPDEKVALDVAIGAAYAGRKALAAMNHVGLNVAADLLFYASHTGTKGSLVIVCADDPGMHSSQNEQDNRRYAKFTQVPCIKPTDSQEAKDLVGVALELSHRFDTPVILRVTTRISHSDGVVDPYDLAGVEKALRWAQFLSPDGTAVVADHRVPPLSVSLSQFPYPDDAKIQEVTSAQAGAQLPDRTGVGKRLGQQRGNAGSAFQARTSRREDLADCDRRFRALPVPGSQPGSFSERASLGGREITI